MFPLRSQGSCQLSSRVRPTALVYKERIELIMIWYIRVSIDQAS